MELVVDGRTVGPCQVASTRRARRAGLLAARPGDDVVPLWFPGVRGVHSAGMRIAIDVAFVDAGGRVVDVVAPLRRWRLARTRWRARSTLEARAGAFQGWRLQVGSVVEVRP